MPTYRRAFPGQPDEISRARHFTYHHLRRSPVVAEVCLMVSEVATNAVRHTRSGELGGQFTLALTVGEGSVRVEVADEGSAEGEVPQVEAMTSLEAERGRGLAIVHALADRHGVVQPNTVWFQITWEPE